MPLPEQESCRNEIVQILSAARGRFVPTGNDDTNDRANNDIPDLQDLDDWMEANEKGDVALLVRAQDNDDDYSEHDEKENHYPFPPRQQRQNCVSTPKKQGRRQAY